MEDGGEKMWSLQPFICSLHWAEDTGTQASLRSPGVGEGMEDTACRGGLGWPGMRWGRAI